MTCFKLIGNSHLKLLDYYLLLKFLNKDGTNLAPYLGLVVSKRRDVLECVNNVNK